MSDEKTVQHEAAFRPRARLVSILGEHLISDQAVGLVELVKNAYDADVTEVEVELLDLGRPENTTVAISDNGCGMTMDDVRTKWLSPAVDHKERDKRENRRTPLGRLPIGEKGANSILRLPPAPVSRFQKLPEDEHPTVGSAGPLAAPPLHAER